MIYSNLPGAPWDNQEESDEDVNDDKTDGVGPLKTRTHQVTESPVPYILTSENHADDVIV